MSCRPGLLALLSVGPTFRDFQQAFAGTTGLPVGLSTIGDSLLPFAGQPEENPFCALMASHKGTREACIRCRRDLVEASSNGPAIRECAFGLVEVSVPLRIGHEVIGHLQTGQILQAPADQPRCQRMALAVRRLKGDLRDSVLRTAYVSSPVIPPKRLHSMVDLLRLFASQIASQGELLATRVAHLEPVAVTRAREFISTHLAEPLTLGNVAAAVHISPFHLCRLFRDSGGLRFRDLIALMRVERARSLLANPQKRISEAAFEAGFGSLTSFNRCFRSWTGLSPTGFREQLANAEPSPKSRGFRKKLSRHGVLNPTATPAGWSA